MILVLVLILSDADADASDADINTGTGSGAIVLVSVLQRTLSSLSYPVTDFTALRLHTVICALLCSTHSEVSLNDPTPHPYTIAVIPIPETLYMALNGTVHRPIFLDISPYNCCKEKYKSDPKPPLVV